MSITSLAFAVFCIGVIPIYWLLPGRFRTGWLFAISVGFVITWSWELAGILLVVATVNYYLGRWLAGAGKRRGTFLWAGILFNVLTLVVLKYSHFYTQALIRLLARVGIEVGSDGLKFLVSIGLSFIVLQMVSYLVDIYKRQMTAEKRWLEFAVYVLYFPKLISGPIERAKAFIPKLDQHASLTSTQITQAVALILIGLIRKRLFADPLNAMIPKDAFVTPLNYSASILFSWLLAYAFALYNDFAGYSSIVRGVSALFGIELTNNFSNPYLSRSFSEFWNRWHISLSNWLRDYIYFPTARALLAKFPARESVINIVIPPIVTMLVSGLWHELSWSLLLWGGLHGGYLVLERISRLRGPNIPPNEQPIYRQMIGTVIVFFGVILAWLPFRMDLVTAKRYLAVMILPAHWVAPDWGWLNDIQYVWERHLPIGSIYRWNIPDPRIILVLIFAVLFDWLQNRKRDELMFLKWPKWAQIILYIFAIFGLLMMAFSDTRLPFVYQGF